MSKLRNWLNAVMIGTIASSLEGILLLSAAPELPFLVFTENVLFWFTCGVIIYFTETGIRELMNGILLSVFLSLPWYISIAVIPKEFDHLLPLIIQGIIFGAVIGFLTKKLKGKV